MKTPYSLRRPPNDRWFLLAGKYFFVFNHNAETNLVFRQLDNEVVLFKEEMQRQQEAFDKEKRRLVDAKMRVNEQEAANWRETNAIRTQQADIETKQAVIKREKGMLADRVRQVQLLEDQRRRNRFVIWLKRCFPNTDGCNHRTVSEAFIEDSFATLSARAVVENLTYVTDYSSMSPFPRG
jgi:hypothetical protein